MGLYGIDLNEKYDLVVAVTQNGVNESLALYLHQQPKTVGLYFNVVDGNYKKAPDPNTANFTFTGTLDYRLDAKGNPVDIVLLHSSEGPQTVIYNLTFSNAQFIAKSDGVNVSQPGGGDPSIISFLVKPQWGKAANVPGPMQRAISEAVGNQPPGMSIQYLYLDLTTAKFDSLRNVTGMPLFAQENLEGMMKQYLADSQAAGGPLIVGYAAMGSGQSGLTPTYTPTAVDFCVSQYRDANGGTTNPGLDTLNYLIMTDDAPMPGTAPTGFNFNFVDDETEQGAIVVRRGLVLGILLGELNCLLKPISPVAATDATPTDISKMFLLNAGTDHELVVLTPPQNGTVATYTYTSPTASSSNYLSNAVVQMDYSSSCRVTVNGPQVSLIGSANISAEMGFAGPQFFTAYTTLPPTVYPWSMDFLLQMDPKNNGRVMFAQQKIDLTMAPEPQQGQQRAFNDFVGHCPAFLTDPGGIRQALNSQAQGLVASSGGFIYPGGSTLLFKNPALSKSLDLAANITYLTPTVN